MSRYKIYQCVDFKNYYGPEQVELGKVVDTEVNEDVLHIWYNRDLYKNDGHHVIIHLYLDENGVYPVVEVDDYHRECLYNDPAVFLCIALHEYAHYIHGDLTNSGYTTEEIYEERGRCILEGRVMDMELKADAFALYYVGKEVFMHQIDYSIKKCRERSDESTDMAIKEFEMRRMAALKLCENSKG